MAPTNDFDGVINPPAEWGDVPQLSTEARALGGETNPMNAQAVALAKQTRYLKEEIENKEQVYKAGVRITSYNQLVLFQGDNQLYRLVPSVPLPYIIEGNWNTEKDKFYTMNQTHFAEDYANRANESRVKAEAAKNAAKISEDNAKESEENAAEHEETALKTIPIHSDTPPVQPLPNVDWINTITGQRFTNMGTMEEPVWVEVAAAMVVDNAAQVSLLRSELGSDVGSELVGFKQAGVGAVDRTLADKARELVSVKDFGAVGDGITDDTDAINLAFDYLRSLTGSTDNSQRFPVSIIFPPGKYLVTSVNATFIWSYGWSVHSYGAEIICKTPGKVVFDLLGSRYGTFNNLVIRGDTTTPPKIGIQVGYSHAGVSAGSHSFNECFIQGHFTRASFANFGSESTSTTGCELINTYPSSEAYCLIHDSENYWGVTSDYTDVNVPANTPYSFVQVNHTRLQMVRVAGGGPYTGFGTAVWIGSTSMRHRFDSSYIAVGPGEIGIDLVFRPSIGLGHQSLYLDIGFETTGMSTAVRFNRIENGSSSMSDFTFRDHGAMVADQLFSSTSNTGAININGMQIYVPRLVHDGNNGPVNGLFNDPSKFLSSNGVIVTRSGNGLKGLPYGFTGQIYCYDGSANTYPVGSVDVDSTLFAGNPVNFKVTKGERRFYGTTASVASGSLQNLPYTSINGNRVYTPNLYSSVVASISTNNVAVFEPNLGSGKSALICLSSDQGGGPQGIFWIRVSEFPSIQALTNLGADINTSTGELTGTTGDDGKITVSAASDGRVYVENRRPSTLTLVATFISGSPI